MDIARTIARMTPELTAEKVAGIFRSGGENRVVALAYIQARPELYSINVVEDAIRGSRSAFEQYQAIKAARETIGRHPDLAVEEVRSIRDTIEEARHDPRMDGDRLFVAQQAIAAADRRITAG